MTASWYRTRLLAMDPAEIVEKGRQRLRRNQWERRPPSTPRLRGKPEFVDRSPLARILPDLRASPSADVAVAAAARILEGDLEVLGVRHDRLLPTPDFFHDPSMSGSAGRPTAGADTSRSMKHVWELSRHQYLTIVAMAFALDGDERFARRVEADLSAWMAASPFMAGVHWSSGIEIGMRLQSWIWLRRLLGTWSGVTALFEENPIFVEQLARHQQWLAAFPSTGSSANNHRIAEVSGLAAAATAFPWFADSERWREEASSELAEQLRAQTFPSGINRELASGYHTFVLELTLPAVVELEWGGHGFAAWHTVASMLDAQAGVCDQLGGAPRQGDDDSAHGVLLDRPDHDAVASQLATGAALFGALDWWPVTRPDLRSMLLGDRSLDVGDRPSVRRASFDDAGMAIVRDGDTWWRFDVGPHGLGPLYAHAHADALALEVRHQGVEIVADPGTFCYGNDPVWRDHFRSTAAHATLSIDGLDQSMPSGTFLWSSVARTRLLHDETVDGTRSVLGEHDGYLGRFGVLHQRRVVWTPEHRTLTVTDRLVGSDPTVTVPVELRLPLGPLVDLGWVDGVAQLSWEHGGRALAARLVLPPELRWSANRGSIDPIDGWHSSSFGKRVPAWSIRGVGTVGLDHLLTTVLHLPIESAELP